jgi:NTP pyrophosphatase (non-canonical NTP hydrolase)
METQRTISEWADAVGINPDPYRAVFRAGEELQEALDDLAAGRITDAGVELADVVICLHVAASKLGIDLQATINSKMQVNRNRKWRLDETGCAYHIK